MSMLIPWQRAFLFAIDTVSTSFKSAAAKREAGKEAKQGEEKKQLGPWCRRADDFLLISCFCGEEGSLLPGVEGQEG